MRRRVGMIWLVVLAGAALAALAVGPAAAAYQDSWVKLADYPQPLGYKGINPNLAQSGGKVYVLGGATVKVESPDIQRFVSTDRVSVYDPATDTWSDLNTKLPYSVEYAATVTTPDGRMWVIGGTHHTAEAETPSRRVQIYDPSTNSWATAARLPAGGAYKESRAVTNSTGRIWDFDTRTGHVWMYQPSTNTWTARRVIPSDQTGAGVAWATNTGILVMGGGQSTRVARIYNTIQNTWHKVAQIPIDMRTTSARRGTDGRVYSFQTDYRGEGATQIYNAATNKWTTGALDPDTSGGRPVVRVPGGFISVGGQSDLDLTRGTNMYH